MALFDIYQEVKTLLFSASSGEFPQPIRFARRDWSARFSIVNFLKATIGTATLSVLLFVFGLFVSTAEAKVKEVPIDIGLSVHIDPNGGHPLWKPPKLIGAGVPARKIVSDFPEVALHVPADWDKDGESISLRFITAFYDIGLDDPEPGDWYRINFDFYDPVDESLKESIAVFVTVPDPWNSAFKVMIPWANVSELSPGETYDLTISGEEDPPIPSRGLAARIGGILFSFPEPMFSDGFESGDTTAWSETLN